MSCREPARRLAKRLLHPSLKQIPWRLRWARQTAAFKKHPATTLLKTSKWTLGEIIRSELSFTLGARIFAVPRNNMIGLFADVEGSFEAALMEFIGRHLPRGATVCDVGANIGVYTVFCSDVVGSEGRVVSVEAHPRTFSFLERNVRSNGCTNAILIHTAVGDRSGVVTLEWDPENSGATHVAKPNVTGTTVPLVTLDDALAEQGIASLDYLKIDVEGYEINVLKGARRIITNSPKLVVQTEVDRRHLARYGYRAEDLQALMAQMGFTSWQVRAEGIFEAEGLPDEFGDVLWVRPGAAGTGNWQRAAG
jgi:FkbM family methyltransferase